jgi:Xaa-Pro dipeptidase
MASTADHLERIFAAMADAEVDVLILGREANARYVSGASRLWLAGTRPFAPGCVVVRASAAVHLLSVTDDGVPISVPPERLYPISWNPANLIGAVAAAAAGVPVRRVGVDGMSPLFAQLLRSVFPNAELSDGEALLRAVRRVKTADDVTGIRAAVAVAEQAFDAVRDAATPGVRMGVLKGVFEERMAQLGVTTPAFEPRIEVHGSDWSMRAGVIRDGWEGSFARTWPGGGAAARAAIAAAVDVCRPGVTVADLESRGLAVEGVGLGHEEVRADDVLVPNMVVYLEATVEDVVHGDPVWITRDGAEVLTSRS